MKARKPLQACLLALSALLATPTALHSQPYVFTTAAGTAGSSGTSDGTNSNARFLWPEGVAADTSGNVFVADTSNNSIRQLSPSPAGWVVKTLAGHPPLWGGADGTNSTATFEGPSGIAVATNGDLYVADFGNGKIRKVSPVGTNWVVTTLTLTGDGIWKPQGIVIDRAGNLFVTDHQNFTICRLTPDGTNWAVKIIAGTPGHFGTVDGTGTNALFCTPFGIGIDGAGILYIADDYSATVRMVSPSGPDWIVTTIAGSTNRVLGNLDGTNAAAQFFAPTGIAVDSSGAILVMDQVNGNIRKIMHLDTNWVVTTVAGPATNQNKGSSDGIGSDARFNWSSMITIDQSGNLFVADTDNYTIRQGRVYLPPLLLTARSKSIELSWPTNAAGFQLEKSTSPQCGAAWATVPGFPAPSGTNYTVTTGTTDPAAFYHLRWHP